MTRPVLVEIKQPRFVPKKAQKPERFVISEEVLRACHFETVEATLEAMKAVGICRLPFLDCVIEMPQTALAFWYSHAKGPRDQHFREQYARYVKSFSWRFKNEDFFSLTQIGNNGVHYIMSPDEVSNMSEVEVIGPRKVLIVLLATRNIVKERTHNKLAKLGIGKDRFEYTTVLRLPAEAYRGATGAELSGRHVPMHLRRGHARWQWAPRNGEFVYVGPGANDYERVTQGTGTHTPIFIEPAFVNADDDFVSARREYKLTSPVQAA